ncbi:MAG TPA: hypothetical protein PLD27_13410, partial [bacterium]|nr:hypothetical protein [bacterium]
FTKRGEEVTPVPKILMIAYYFPPLGGGGVPRPLKFCKYLPKFGWQPIVLTSKNGVGPVYDKTLLDELNTYKDVKVYRTLSFELGALKKLLLRQSAKQLERSEKQNIDSKIENSRHIIEQKNNTKSPNTICRFTKRIITLFFQKIYNLIFIFLKKICIPDDKILWALPSFFAALRIIKKENPDLIFVTIPPYSSFILGALLKKCTGKKLVVDYRDL